MSYYRGSMSARGRGSSFRGNSYRGSSSYRGGAGYRGSNSYSDRGGYSSHSSRGGRYHSSNNSYNSGGYQESRSRYPSNSDKYSRGRDDGYNRRSSYRPDESYSSSRDHSRGSPDRKRMRTDQGSSTRRSNDGGYNGGGGDGYGNQRYENASYVERRYSSERHARSPKDFRTSRNESSMYSKGGDSSSMPPPRSRGSFRGRLSTRGIRGRRIIRRDPYMRKNAILLSSRRVLSRSIDYARRLKIQRLRSSIRKRESSSNESEKEDWDAEIEELDKKKNAEKQDSPTPSKKKSPKKEKSEKKEDSNDENVEKEAKTESGEEQQAEESEKGDNQEESTKERPKNVFDYRSFLKLNCIHCSAKYATVKEYLIHLRGNKHNVTMRRIALQNNARLAKMRLLQRNNQRDLDEKNKNNKYLRTKFCQLCKLNYRQLRARHQASEAHREIKKFLIPYCRTCRLTFNSPMLYESHLCSLEHLKRKARVDYLKGKKTENDDPGSGDEDVKELDLDNFMTLDSVGDVDDDEEDTDGVAKDSSETDKPAKKPKPEINVGNEYVHKVEVYYCDLCKMYLPRQEEPESALKKHCRTRTHLERYVRDRDDKELRKQAEKLHRKNQEAKEAKENKDDSVDISSTSTPKKGKEEANGDQEISKADSASNVIENGSLDEEDTVDDKLWADVDKDLGDILREVEPNKSSDDEDDSRTTSVRYDRFRYSDKKTAGDDKNTIKLEDSIIAEEEETTATENLDNVKADEN